MTAAEREAQSGAGRRVQAKGGRRPLLVKKFGGTSVASVDRMREVARIACESRDAGNDVLVVVSAMSGETDRLLALAKKVLPLPDGRELDVLASTGEQVSCALVSMCIQALGGKASSFLGFQVPLVTNDAFTTARIQSVEKDRVRSALDEGQIPVVAGFQGVDASMNVTTLGRGGSDTTAVALAAALGADACEIYTDVEGVFTSDPNVCPAARKLASIPYEDMLELASLGAKVLQVRSVEIAMKYDVPVHVRSSFTKEEGTWIAARDRALEARVFTGVACARAQARVELCGVPPRPSVLTDLTALLAELGVCTDLLSHIGKEGTGEGRTDIAFTVPESELPKVQPALERAAAGLGTGEVRVSSRLAKVSLVGIGVRSDPSVAAFLCGSLSKHGISVSGLIVTDLRVSCLVEDGRADQAVRVLHEAFGLSHGGARPSGDWPPERAPRRADPGGGAPPPGSIPRGSLPKEGFDKMLTRYSTPHHPLRLFAPAFLLVSAAAAGCQGETDGEGEDVAITQQADGLDTDPIDTGTDARMKEAKRLFQRETFGGNGRTCTTCHGNGTGTVSPEEAQARYAENPADPLFLWDGSDDFAGNGVTRMLTDATVLVRLPLPPNIHLASDPTATSVVVRRGIPTTKNTPALDTTLMYDGRAATLVDQASGAIGGHAQASITPTADQLQMITEYEKSSKFFTSDELRTYAAGGPAPGLPQGNSPAQKRGRVWFEDAPVTPALNAQSSKRGLCAQCHSGALLNETNGRGFLPLPPFPTPAATTSCTNPATAGNPVPKGRRFESVLVAELNIGHNPLYNFLLTIPTGARVPLPPMSDPGRALITGNFRPFPAMDGDLFKFKIPILRGLKKSAPYFHDNSAKTIEDVVNHYALFFRLATDCNIDGDPPLVMTDQDKADLVSYLKML